MAKFEAVNPDEFELVNTNKLSERAIECDTIVEAMLSSEHKAVKLPLEEGETPRMYGRALSVAFDRNPKSKGYELVSSWPTLLVNKVPTIVGQVRAVKRDS